MTFANAQSLAPVVDEPPSPTQRRDGDADVFGSVGRFFEDGAANFRSHLLGAKRRADELNEEAEKNRRNAAAATQSALGAMAPRQVAEGRRVCRQAPNGAPDCQSAAEQLCRDKGFSTGSSLDFTSAEKCPARVLLSGRDPPDRTACVTETFISRAMCQ